MYMGPDHLIVAARVAFSDQIDAGTVRTCPSASTGGWRSGCR